MILFFELEIFSNINIFFIRQGINIDNLVKKAAEYLKPQMENDNLDDEESN